MKSDAILQLKKEPILHAIFDVVNTVKAKAYLVGGVLRNLALSRPFGFDYDIVLDKQIKETANLIAGKLKGSPFLLDKKLGSYRVNIKSSKGVFNIDISPYKRKDIVEDLRNRDFTINALAVDMNALFKKSDATIIDIFKGINDAENKIIRMLKTDIFDEDPLRLLRAESLSAYFEMQLGNIPKEGLFKLTLFLHDVGKTATMEREGERIRFIGHEVEGEIINKRIGRRLKLSKAAIVFIAKLTKNHHRVFNLASLAKLTNRSKAHLFRVMGGEDGLLLLLLALADARATRD